ncbi:MAG: hypothetical protein AB1714_11170 [Acidobacteriota bacterium]
MAGKAGRVALAILLLFLAAYESAQTLAQRYYYSSQTSPEMHVVTRSFDARLRALDNAIALGATWEMHHSRGRLFLDEAFKRHQEGDAAQRDARLGEAIAELKRAAEMEPRESDIYFDLARAYLAYGFPITPYRTQAIQAFREALARDPRDQSKLLAVAKYLLSQYPFLPPGDRRFAQEVTGRTMSDSPDQIPSLATAWDKTGEKPQLLEPYILNPDALLRFRKLYRE